MERVTGNKTYGEWLGNGISWAVENNVVGVGDLVDTPVDVVIVAQVTYLKHANGHTLAINPDGTCSGWTAGNGMTWQQLQGLSMLQPRRQGKSVSVYLYDDEIRDLTAAGNGNVSEGIRKTLAMLRRL